MSSFPNIPIWAVALVLAALAPWCVGVLQAILEERRRGRTRALLRELGLPADEPTARPAKRSRLRVSDEDP